MLKCFYQIMLKNNISGNMLNRRYTLLINWKLKFSNELDLLVIKLSEDLKEKPIYITMEKCFQYKIVSVLSQSSYEQKMREKDLQISFWHWSFSTWKLV